MVSGNSGNLGGADKFHWQDTLHISENLDQVKSAFSTCSARVKDAAVVSGRNLGQATSIKSLKSLLPPAATERLKDAKETTQKFIVREFANVFSRHTIPKEKTNLSMQSDKYESGAPLRDSSHVVATDEELQKYDESCLPGGATATHLVKSEADVTKKNGVVSEIRKIYEKYQKNEQQEPCPLGEYIKSLSKEDAKKFLSLKPAELKAIQGYTGEEDYRLQNYVLNLDKHNLKTWLTNIKKKYSDGRLNINDAKGAAEQRNALLASAINKLPQYKGTVYRSERMVPSDLNVYKNAYLKGKSDEIVVPCKKFLSTTKSPEQALGFDQTQDNSGRVKVVYQIDPPPGGAFNGADITHLSAKLGEEEVLLNYGLTFIFTEYKEMPAGIVNGVKHEAYVILKVQQVPPDSIPVSANG